MRTSLARSGPMHAASLLALKRGSRASFRHGEQGEWHRGQLTLSEDEALLTCAHYDAPAERQHTELSDVARVECSSVPGRGEGLRLLLTSPRPSDKLAEPAGTGAQQRDLFVVLDAPEETRAAASALLELAVGRGLQLATVAGDAAAVRAARGEGAEQGAEAEEPGVLERGITSGPEEAAPALILALNSSLTLALALSQALIPTLPLALALALALAHPSCPNLAA